MVQKQVNNWNAIASVGVFLLTQTAGIAWYFSSIVGDVKHIQEITIESQLDRKQLHQDIQELIELRYQLARCDENLSRIDKTLLAHTQGDKK